MTTQIKKPFSIEQYFKSNRLINQYHCHNKNRKKNDLGPIHPLEYIAYRQWADKNKNGTIAASGTKGSLVLRWEEYKKEKKLVFLKLNGRINWKLFNEKTKYVP